MSTRPPCTVRPDELIDARDILDALGAVARRMGAKVRAERESSAGDASETFEVTRCDECNAVSEVESDGTMASSGGPDLCPSCAAKPRGAENG